MPNSPPSHLLDQSVPYYCTTTLGVMESAESMCLDLEEWQSLQDPKSRRRIQNRIAQRVYSMFCLLRFIDSMTLTTGRTQAQAATRSPEEAKSTNNPSETDAKPTAVHLGM